MWRVWGKAEIHTRVWWGNLREDLEVVVKWNVVE